MRRLIAWLDDGDRIAFGQRASLVGILCNVLLVLAKGATGIASGSISMVADAVNNLMDATSSVVSLVGFKLANKPADTGHPYGHGRYEYLAGLAVSVLVVIAGVELVQGSVDRILHPAPTHYSWVALAVLALSVAAKLLLARFDRMAGEHIGSSPLQAAAIDSRNDAIATSAVLVGALVSRFADVQVDGLLGILVGLFVLVSGIELMRDTVNPLVGRRPDPELVERVRERILAYPEVLGTHDLLVHDYGPDHQFASAHVEMAAERDPVQTHEIIDRIERDLRKSEGLPTILHYDPIVTSDERGEDLRAVVARAVCRVDERLTIHDLRVTDTHEGRKLSFDCVRPENLELDDDALGRAIECEVRADVACAACRITFDEGYSSPVA